MAFYRAEWKNIYCIDPTVWDGKNICCIDPAIWDKEDDGFDYTETQSSSMRLLL